MQSPTFTLTESDSKFNQQKQLTVTEAGRAVKVETDLPHLVSLGSGRFSTAVTLHPLPEGKTTVGCMNADIIIRGRGIHPEHCYFIHERDVVMLFPISQLITVDGAKVTRPTILSQGTMICFGRSSYFRFNHPVEAQHLKREYFDIYSETYSTSDLFSKKEPLYANEEMSNSSATEGSLSIPFYDNVSEIRASHDKKSANGDSQSTICDSSSLLSSDPDHTLSRYHGTCSPVRPLSPFHSDFVVFPDGSRRAINNDQFFNSDRMTSSDLFDEKASHIPRPMSPSFEGLTVDNWSGYDNVLELKEAMTKQEVKKECTPELKNFKSESVFSATPLVNCNDRFSPVGVFISDAKLPVLKMEHDPLEKQASELPDKRKVTFSVKEAVNASTMINNVSPLEISSKPPSGKHAIDQFQKTENRREKKFVWSKRNTCPATESEVPIKSSFFKSLIRSRSPSPSSKRSPSPTRPLNTDVARRLSEPLKKSFKNPDTSLKEKFMGMQSSRLDSSSSDEESSVRISSVSSTCPDQTDPPNNVVNVSTFNTTDDEKSSTHLLAEHEITDNLLKRDLKSGNENVSLDSYKGEKLFSRDTVTTSIAVPGVATYQTSNFRNNLISSPRDIKPPAEVKSRSNRKQKNDVPIYDRVYDGSKQAGKENSNLDQAITENRLSEDVIEFVDRMASKEKGFDKQSNNIFGNMLLTFVNETKQAQTGCDSNSITNVTNLVKVNNSQIVHMNKTPEVMKSQDHPSMESCRGTQSNSSPAINAFKPISETGSDKAQHSSVKTPKMCDDFHRIRDDRVIENVQGSFGQVVDFEYDPSLCKTTNSAASGNRSASPTKIYAGTSDNLRLFQDEVVSSKPPLCESNKAIDEETSALFGVRRGILRRMKLLKHKIEEIEEKERNIENLITRNSMSIDVLEKKQISEKDIKEFFSNATSVLDNLEEEGKRVEHQFMEANEYLTRIDKTIGEIEKRKKQNGSHNNVNNRNNNNNSRNGKKDEFLISSTAHGYSSTNANHDSMFQRSSEPSITLDVKISSGSSDNSSISGSALLLDRSLRKIKGSSGSLNPADNNATIFMPRNSTCRPLTRYFPVTDSSFDLKCYIEMSGHNLDMCKTVFVESYRCCGYLSKMGRKWKKWHKRWFVFDRTKRQLACYLNEPLKQHQQPRSVCYFQSIRDVFADHLHMVKSPNPDFTFCVKLIDKNLFLMASNADAMRIWIDVLFTGAEAYQDVS